MSHVEPFVLARAEVLDVARVSPTFARITFAGPELDGFGNPGRTFDQRIKIIFPAESHGLPDLVSTGSDWYGRWLALPEEQRGVMRTYSIRDVVDHPEGTRVVVDIVLHLSPGATGPGAQWAAAASPGDQVLVLGPRRGCEVGGIEFSPGPATELVLAGDETAAPAIARILEDLDADVAGVAFIEVPHPDDVLFIDAPPRVDVRWLVRNGQVRGARLTSAVLVHLDVDNSSEATPEPIDDQLVWETPSHSAAGEDLDVSRTPPQRYYWIAGESGVVKGLRRHLVGSLGIDRTHVAFMGYWKMGRVSA